MTSRMLQGSYLEAEARGVDLDSKTVTCTYAKPFIGAQFNERSFELPYDVLVVAVSSLHIYFPTQEKAIAY